jgi:hypothetical protein
MIARHISIVSLLLLGVVQAGPPMLTDDPDTPGPGVWEVNVSAAGQRAGKDWSWELPILDINYGVGDRIQLKYEVAWAWFDTEGGSVSSGLGSSEIGIKGRFLDADEFGWDVSIYPQYRFEAPGATIRRGVLEEGAEFLLPIEVGRSFGDAFVYGEAGYAWLDSGADEWVFGAVAGYELSGELTIMAELFWIAEEGFGEHEVIANAGFKWHWNESVALIGSAGRSVKEPAGEPKITVMYLGFQLLF